ncbi:MAG TPA: aldehyde dehydrogenase family protein [Thermoplasmata archaeon]|nr:aldehyde dehydrogenase family protein [Thermoplasmata archaeon]
MTAASQPSYELFIGGKGTSGTSGAQRTLLNPATNRPLASTALADAEDARHAMEVAQTAFDKSGWAGDDGSKRAKALFRLASKLEEQADAFAELESLNQGKTLREAKGDIGFVVRTLEYMAGLADKLQGETIPVPGPRLDYTLREPMGVTVHIAPWNFPLVLAMRSVAPALGAGNAVVLKPATLTPLTALRVAQLSTAAGVPDGIFNVVVGDGAKVGEALITDPRCRAVSFTGSREVGQRVAELAGKRRVPITLELGGKGPVLVYPDADLDRAAKAIGWGIFGNAGQMCWAGSRLLVHASVHDEVLSKVRSIAEKLKVGPGGDAGVEMGPLVSAEQRSRVLQFIEEARATGTKVAAGGTPYASGPLSEGYFVPPTVLDAPPPDARVVREEVFGPVLSVQSFTSMDESIRLANDTEYGLLASIWTKDLATAHSVARQLETGMVTVNDPPSTYPQSPFAGYKDSGLGFEQGMQAVEFFTRRKNVLLNLAVPKPRA